MNVKTTTCSARGHHRARVARHRHRAQLLHGAAKNTKPRSLGRV